VPKGKEAVSPLPTEAIKGGPRKALPLS